MNNEQLELVQARLDLQSAYMDYIADWERAGEDTRGRQFEEARQDFPARIAALDKQANNIDIPEGRVPSTTFWLLKDHTIIIGEVRLRHWLNAYLEHHGGHIGYDVRPSYRHKGYGTTQLALTLPKACELGLKRVLLTCDTDNIASARVIEKNGGKLTSQGISEVTGKMHSLYWIDL